MKEEKTCELCRRTPVETTVHHLIPKEESGVHGPTANVCIPCHKNIHALYTNKELAVRLSSVEELQRDERILKFIKWISKQPHTIQIKTKRSNAKKQKMPKR